jgi:hypothetical protein
MEVQAAESIRLSIYSSRRAPVLHFDKLLVWKVLGGLEGCDSSAKYSKPFVTAANHPCHCFAYDWAAQYAVASRSASDLGLTPLLRTCTCCAVEQNINDLTEAVPELGFHLQYCAARSETCTGDQTAYSDSKSFLHRLLDIDLIPHTTRL